MVDDTEELEPLFDYSRVQPNIVRLDDDDDDDDVVCVVTKKRKKNSQSQHVKNDNGKKTNVEAVPVTSVVDLEDDDWLPSPPKVTSKAHKKKTDEEDSTLKNLRLKKKELASFAESAKELLKSVENSLETDNLNSLNTSKDDISEKTSKPYERAKILISVQDKEGTKQIRMFMDDNFERIIKTYAEKMKCDLKQIVLSFDGDKISSSETPASLGMEDDDIIEIHVKSS
ncbi:Ubiquitin superfamily protein [Trifolium repens]|nr:Ubiquitin superfamily protein [Trifolium repens]KAK2458667.1 Ubiquitin superfamily protein [Trifolium repens]